MRNSKNTKIQLEFNSEMPGFSDISSELYREYVFPNGDKLTIKNPLFLNVSSSGGHRLFTSDGTSYYIQPKEGWYISWKTKEGAKVFIK